jgi:ADP-dependent NAD(P)H-hydrate dehydratase / NAD(P)H-hydrate epimerase
MALPVAVYSSQQIRALDAYWIESRGVPGYTLMKRAAEASLRVLRTRWPTAMRIVVVCGGGNNGGDGYVLARFAQAAGLEVSAIAIAPGSSLEGDARRAYDEFVASGGIVLSLAPDAFDFAEVIVDALLGIGITGEVRANVRAAIDAINAANAPVLSLDVPSGLDSDSGEVCGAAVQAEATIAFVGLKTGLLLGAGPEHVGALLCDDLEVEAPPTDPRFTPRLMRLVESEIAQALPRRPRHAHKGIFGHVLLIGGGIGMPGALRLAGEAALRSGAGLVTVAGHPDNLAAVASGCPELMYVSVREPHDLRPILERADVIGIGPGLGRDAWARELCALAFASAKPKVVDADALNILADGGPRALANAVLTPHPGEAARLLGVATANVQNDRLAAVELLATRYAATTVLKGAGTLVSSNGGTSFCERGNPGMASPGMGDVLTGVICSLYAQVHEASIAARVGVLVHSIAGDLAARDGERGMLASDVMRELRRIVNR